MKCHPRHPRFRVAFLFAHLAFIICDGRARAAADHAQPERLRVSGVRWVPVSASRAAVSRAISASIWAMIASRFTAELFQAVKDKARKTKRSFLSWNAILLRGVTPQWNCHFRAYLAQHFASPPFTDWNSPSREN